MDSSDISNGRTSLRFEVFNMARFTAVLIVFVMLFSTLAQVSATIPIKEYSSGVGITDNGAYGTVVKKMFNFTGDGLVDLVASAPFDSTKGANAGAVYIFDGIPDDYPINLNAQFAQMKIYGQPGENFGFSLDVGDFNGDGADDLLVGAPTADSNTGKAYIFLGGIFSDRTSLDANSTFNGTFQGEGFGVSVASASNLNGDAYDDFAIGSNNGDAVQVYAGRKHMETGMITLPEVPQDYPNPVDFTNGLNSTNNTFGWGNTSEGWDWATGIYGGTNTDVHFAPVGGSDPYLKIVIGNQTNGNGANPCPAGSGGYGMDFNLTQADIDAISDGAELRVKFDWYTQSKGLMWWQDEYYWVKARIWSSATVINYLGYNQDNDNNPGDDENNNARTDATNDIFYQTGWGGNTLDQYSSSEDWYLNGYLTGAHSYYFDVGGKLGDWSSTTQDFQVRVDNVTVWTEFQPIAVLMGREYTSGYGRVLAGAGDVNGDGLDDLIVGASGLDETHVYFGSRHFKEDFLLYAQIAMPELRDKNDTTDEQTTNDLKYDDGQQFGPPPPPGYYGVDRGQSMYISKWDIGKAKGTLLWAYFYSQYWTEWSYNGNNYVEWSVDGTHWKQTDMRITPSNQERNNWDDQDGPYDFTAHGLTTLSQIRNLDLRYNNTAGGGGGPKYVFFDYAWVYFISQQPSNVTIKGKLNSELGSSVSGLGSINGDPYDDIIIGAPRENIDHGAAYVFLGGKGFIGDLSYTDAFAAFTGSSSTSRCGMLVAGAGRFSLDKFPDIAISDGGNLYIVRGGPRMTGGKLTDVAQYSASGGDPTGGFPSSLAPLGDINFGHAGEILVSERFFTAGSGHEQGKVYILYNSDEEILMGPLLVDFYPKGDQTIKEGETLAFYVTVKAPTELEVSYNWYLDGALVTLGTDKYTYTTDYLSAGLHKVRIEVTDGFRYAKAEWNVSVLDVNFPPEVKFYPAVDPIISEGDCVRFWADAKDPDHDTLVYKWAMDSGPLQDTSSSYVYNAGFDTAGKHIVILNVSDGHFDIGHQWQITVKDVNRPPIIDTANPSSDPTVTEGQAQAFNITAHDPDGDPLTVVWSVDGQAVALNTYNQTLKTDIGKTGVHTVVASVSDGEYTTKHTWTLTVAKGNQPPIIDWVKPLSPLLVDEGSEVVFFMTAHDPDGDPIHTEWTLDGARVIGNTSYDFRVPIEPKGQYALRVTVSDGKLNTSYDWTITVNRRPSIDDSWPMSGGPVTSGKTVVTGIKFHDPDKDPLTVTWYINDKAVRTERVPSSATATNSSLDMVAPFEKVNEINVRVVVSDGRLTSESKWRFNLTSTTNGAPVAVINMDPSTPKRGKAIKFDGAASHDPEGDIISYEWRFSDGTTATGKQVSRTFDQKGVLTVTLVVTDSRGNTGEATKVLSFESAKVQGTTESPWGLIAFVVLLIVFVALLVYQSFRKGWVGSKKGEDTPEEHTPLEGDDRVRRPEKAPTEDETIEGPFEEVGDEGFEELPPEDENV